MPSNNVHRLNVPGLTANDSVNSATFSFGTTAGLNVDGVLVAPVIPGVPDGGATLALLGGAISVIGLIRRKAS